MPITNHTETTHTAFPSPLPLALRTPEPEDGPALHALVAHCPPLDPNSLYCNLLHCTHFADTSVAAVPSDAASNDGPLLGFISAYIPPAQPDTLFVWQVAVAPTARGQGLGGRMLDTLLQRPICAAVRYVETTITPGNRASWGLFTSWAKRYRAPTQQHLHFERQRHFGGQHDDELLLRIGPLPAPHGRSGHVHQPYQASIHRATARRITVFSSAFFSTPLATP